jgi:hypothetical protein
VRWSLFACLLFIAAASCDGDGCYGGPNGAATKFCQQALEKADPARLAESCKQCCIQEVPYEGRIVNGQCICYR